MNTHTEEKWKPIDQCPKTEGVYYIIRYKDGTFGATTFADDNWWVSGGDGFIITSEQDISHYAEMPE